MQCGKPTKVLKEGFCPSCIRKLSLPAAVSQAETPSTGKPEGWNLQGDKLWKPNRGNGICERCYAEIAKSELIHDNDLGFDICKECAEKRKKIGRKASMYWKEKEPTMRKNNE